MKRFISIFLLLLLLAGCSSTDNNNPKQTVPADTVDYIAMIRSDLLVKDSGLNTAIDKAVKLKLDQVDEDSITVTVTAPNIYTDTMDWFNSVSEEDYSNEALEAQMCKLLEGVSQTNQFSLFLRDGEIVYTDEFLNAATCGVRRFYTALTVMLMEEMEASVNE